MRWSPPGATTGRSSGEKARAGATGASKNGEALKVKPVKSLDLWAAGWFAGRGKHEGRGGGIFVEYRELRPKWAQASRTRSERLSLLVAMMAHC